MTDAHADDRRSLVVVGTGPVADSLVALATLLELRPTVLDDGPAAANACRDLAPGDAVVVLSHDPETAGPALQAAVSGEVGYVGAMGSRRTQQARVDWLRAHDTPDELIASVRGPAGLDLGGNEPAEIALSIMAEAIARWNSRTAQPLKEQPGKIHPELAVGEAACPVDH